MSNLVNKGLLLIISSPAGAGKTTICKKLIDEVDNINLSVSVTTRKKRKDEIEGKHYFFKNEDEFRLLLRKNQFLEYANVFGCLYGTLKKEVVSKINKGIDVIVDIDWQGTQQIKRQKLNYKIVTIFILPPSRDELYKRLLNRDKNDEKLEFGDLLFMSIMGKGLNHVAVFLGNEVLHHLADRLSCREPYSEWLQKCTGGRYRYVS